MWSPTEFTMTELMIEKIWATPTSAQDILKALSSGVILGSAQKTISSATD